MSPDRRGLKHIHTTNILDIRLANFVHLWFKCRISGGFPYFVLQPLNPHPLRFDKNQNADNFFTFVICIRLDNSPNATTQNENEILKILLFVKLHILFHCL